MNWKIWLGIIALTSGAGYYLYTDNIKSKVNERLAQEQLITNIKTNEIKTELETASKEIVNDVSNKQEIVKRQSVIAKSKIVSIPDENKTLSPVLKQTLIEIQQIQGQ